MNDVFLGLIAIGVLVMAAIQVALVVMAARTVQRIAKLVMQLEQDIRPLVANLQAMSADAAKATAVATAQVERADRLFTEMSARLDQTLATVQQTLLGVTRGGAWMAGLKAALSALRDMRHPSRRSSSMEEEDALFIG